MKEILITNDDGFEAKGLSELANALRELPNLNVTIVAPSSEKSACAHSLTLTKPLRFIKIDDGFFKLDDATPSDCVYLALHALFKHEPDLIISGINHGANLGEDITYSGTCGAAMEGVLHGIKSIAFSQFYQNDSIDRLGFDLAKDVVKAITQKVLSGEIDLPEREFLNVNIPAVSRKDFKGFAVVPAGKRTYATHATLNRNPRGVEYYWLGVASLDYEKGESSDISVVNEGFASITPIQLNMTARATLKTLKKRLECKI
ncbi:5'/3'-nucleotidase SurE [Campylobacter sp. faydin G-24]|uniref:5'-nucleotidase SurE n=1 Tax=Campylobacter anatolicus TaxID=2829105 RepID=A0ABS5HGW8_9BACT|nr:5'/3'-nucleotidase SurE [Campylobacter anatolicus]MBR8463526.1 5'/3'-nucleotidase SurE [Campylobacter anatolicus]MBR8465119.1 5'/3'-nucleotidase SurE [Campylobacter anatolicus]